MANENRKIIPALSAGIFLVAVFCAAALCSRSFLEKTCRIEPGQSNTILLIGLVSAAAFFVIFSRWSGPGNRKWMVAGAILLTVPALFLLMRQVNAMTATAGRPELTGQKEIRSTVAFIGKSRDLTRMTSTFTHFADGMQVVETKEDTVFADGRIKANPRTTLSNTLNTSDYWKVVAILVVMALSLAMLCGPIAALIYTRLTPVL